ncbi:MAG TPA: PPOX class F420-dependent oxidoreductase [Terriglobales bacterium]|nr:PPOX class F420-dependent oxidoreductase [Terriglobales bacterium]
MKNVPERFHDLLTEKKAFAHVATLMPDGSPQVTPVWFDVDGDCLRINTARGRAKDHNVERDGRIALSIVDPDNPYRALMMRGRVTEITENGADSHIDQLAKKYLGRDKYPFAKPGERRVMFKISIDRVATKE